MVLGQVVAVEPSFVGVFQQPHALLVEVSQLQSTTVDPVENPEPQLRRAFSKSFVVLSHFQASGQGYRLWRIVPAQIIRPCLWQNPG